MDKILDLFPVLTFVFGIAMVVLNMWMMLKIGKLKEDVTKQMVSLEKDFNEKIDELEDRLPTREQLRFMKREVKHMFINMATQLKLSTKGFEIENDDN